MADDAGKGKGSSSATHGSGNGRMEKASAGSTYGRLGSSSPLIDKVRRRSHPLKVNGDADTGLASPSSLSADPLKLELNRLENELKVKGLELEKLAAESKALKQLSIGKDKAIKVLRDDLESLREKNTIVEKQLESKILELKKTNDDKKMARSSQAAAEATMRRLQSSQKDVASPSIELAIAPLEAQLKVSQKEIAKLQEDTKAQERLIRTKEAALVEADKAVAAAEAKAEQVDDLQNRNLELAKQIEAVQEENKTLDKLYKQKVEDVKKLTAEVASLEEALTAAGASASTIKDYQRQVQDLQAELKITQEELARAKIAVNRVAVVVANEWKDEKDKVIPMKQWLEERKVMQGEAQGLRERLSLAERAVKFETQMKEKFQARLKVLEDGVKPAARNRESGRKYSSGTLQQRTSISTDSLRAIADVEDRTSPSISDDFNGKANGIMEHGLDLDQRSRGNPDDGHSKGGEEFTNEDTVSGILYDVLQKEVVALRRAGAEKDQGLKDRDDAIEMLSKKVELLTRAMETEAKKSRRELWSMEKELAAIKLEIAPDVKRRQASPKLNSSPSIASNKKISPKS